MPALDLEIAKTRVTEEVQRRAEALLHTSHYIHARPELLFAEHLACEHLASVLAREGLEVETGAFGLDTALVATAGTDGPTVAVVCEYDALPGLGHACGHNIIAAAGLGAGLAAAAVADEAGGRVVVLGTPAEEGGGGKILMADRGAFKGVDAALMVHPAGVELTHTDSLAIATWEVQYYGQAAHAAAAPEQGRNALDAAVLGYNAVAALRQHLARTDRVHGVFSKAGDKPNIVPDHTVAEWYVRSATADSLESVKSQVLACLEAGAAAAGCRMEWRSTAPEYSELRHNRPLIELYRDNSTRVGRRPEDPVPGRAPVLSTDMGNVSHLVPSIHPLVKVSPEDISIHSAEFVDWAVSADGDKAVLDAATALAMTVVDLWLRPDARDEVRAAFDGAP